MNFIKLLHLLGLNDPDLIDISTQSMIEIEQKFAQLEVSHPSVSSVKKDFFSVLHSHREVLRKIVNTRTLFNYYTGLDIAKSHFQPISSDVTDREVQHFINRYLRAELDPILFLKMDKNEFESIALLSEAHHLLPQDLVEGLKQKAIEKLELANQILRPRFGNFSKIDFLKNRDFFYFLNQIKDPFIEEKIKGIFSALQFIVKHHPGSDLAKSIFTAMTQYKANDSYFSESIVKYKEITEIHYEPFTVNRTRTKWIIGVVAALIVTRVIVFINDLPDFNFGYPSSEEMIYNEAPEIDPFYTNMKTEIDSFHRFLTRFDQSKVRRLTPLQLQIGENPFETFYAYDPGSKADYQVQLTNKTGYDLLLLEHIMMYDTIKMPNTAFFIPKGKTLTLQPKTENANLVYNVYAGNNLATFQTDQLPGFVRSGSIVEYRFSTLIPNAETIIKRDFIFQNSTQLNYRNGEIFQE